MKPVANLRIASPERLRGVPVAAFTIIELLVVIAVVSLLVATRLPALCRAKTTVKFTHCRHNCRQIGWATMLYRADNNDGYPFAYSSGATNLNNWPMQLLHYLGGYQGVPPLVYYCPSRIGTKIDWPFRMHYQANGELLIDHGDRSVPLFGYKVRRPNVYWMFMDSASSLSVRASGLATSLSGWNFPPISPEYRWHDNGINSVAADGHVDWLRTPLCTPGKPPPSNFLELGDCANGQNSSSSWRYNGLRVKLFTRHSSAGFSSTRRSGEFHLAPCRAAHKLSGVRPKAKLLFLLHGVSEPHS